MSHYDYKGTLLNNIFQSGTTTFSGYENLGTALQFSSKFSNLPNQTLGYENTTNDIGAVCCPKFTKYTSNATHTCNAGATGVYLILVGGGGGGGSGGSDSTYSGDGGGGGGGGGMLALKVSKSNNQTITTPITIVINVGAGGAGAAKRTNNGVGFTGTTGNNTSATIWCSGNDIVAYAGGGAGGTGGPNNNNGVIDNTGGGGGGRGISLSGGTANYSNDNSNNGNAGSGGDDGTGPDGDISYGGNGGQNAYSTKGFFGIESPFTFGDGGAGGIGDTTWSSGFTNGGPGTAGQPGVAYVFEYFD
jgi:hypothetical protein